MEAQTCVATKSVGGWRAVASKVVMRSGRHFVQFTAVEGIGVMFGAIRPGWDVEGGQNAFHVDGHCFYEANSGRRLPDSIDWEGRQGAREQGDRIGMLLDLDQGSTTVWKNDVKLGVMQAEGLSGPLCWAASVYQADSARIESAPAPASPTVEELVAATEAAREIARRQRRVDLGLPLTATDAECEAAEAVAADDYMY